MIRYKLNELEKILKINSNFLVVQQALELINALRHTNDNLIGNLPNHFTSLSVKHSDHGRVYAFVVAKSQACFTRRHLVIEQ